LRQWGRQAQRPEVVGASAAFAGLFERLRALRYTRAALATSTDGVGSKVAVARRMDKHDTIGVDLVGMVVDDLVVCGAEPLFMTDYIACGRVVPERIAAIVKGIAEGCVQAGCALRGW
jgi:phosphoribosylformylglycinamidine cyclo-ligase